MDSLLEMYGFRNQEKASKREIGNAHNVPAKDCSPLHVYVENPTWEKQNNSQLLAYNCSASIAYTFSAPTTRSFILKHNTSEFEDPHYLKKRRQKIMMR